MKREPMNVAQSFAAYARDATTREEYLRVASDMLSRLIGNDAIGWIRLDFDHGLSEVSGTHTGISDAAVAGLLLDVADDHPMVQSFLVHPEDSSVRRMSDLVSNRQLRSTRAYRMLLRPVDGLHMLSLPIARFNDLGSRSWSLNRAVGDFSDADLSMLGWLQPTLVMLDRAYGEPGDFPRPPEQFGLTAREAEVLQLLARGLTAAAIGHLLGISRRTVSNHLSHAYAKLGAHDRVTAVSRAGLFRARS